MNRKKAFLFLADGFEEIEATGTADVLLRGDVQLITVSIMGKQTVAGAHGIPVLADCLFEEVDCGEADALILPGGGPGSQRLNAHEALKVQLVRHSEQRKLIAAICAAPLVLGGLGLLNGRKATCYPGVEPQLTGAILTDAPVVADGHIITGKGPGFAFDFGLAVLTALHGEAKAADVAKDLLLPYA